MGGSAVLLNLLSFMRDQRVPRPIHNDFLYILHLCSVVIIINYLFLHPRSPRCMYDIVHIIVFLLLSNLHSFYSVYFVFTWKVFFSSPSNSISSVTSTS